MKKPMFAVYDNRALVYAAPFVSTNENTAIRDFHQASNDPTSQLFNYPEDFCLYQIAEYDDFNGVIHPLQAHKNLGTASTYKEK